MADAVEIETMKNYNLAFERIDPSISRYPYCIVWTPIPVLSWLFPFIGHMGICTSSGVIRDFAGPYFVSEDNMAFGRPTKYWMLDVSKVYASGSNAWDTAVHNASEEYKQRMTFHLDPKESYQLVKNGHPMTPNCISSHFYSCVGFLKTWLPFCILTSVILAVTLSLNLR
ncbi:hypothetical protein cypCar_00043561 [Cyprinus carpio]|nr:hypothetical protein cypCar_00043561 [Cyprinus carpio]